MKDEKLYWLHIKETAQLIHEYTKGDRRRFLEDRMVRDAAIKNFANLTESADKLSAETKKRFVHIPWRKIYGMRNILVHEYLGELDYNRVWDAIEQNLPTLVEIVETLLKEQK